MYPDISLNRDPKCFKKFFVRLLLNTQSSNWRVLMSCQLLEGLMDNYAIIRTKTEGNKINIQFEGYSNEGLEVSNTQDVML